MATLRATYFFKDALGAGWTETYFNTLDYLNTVLKVQANIPLRAAMLSCNCQLYAWRVSDDEVFRAANSQQVNLTGGIVSGQDVAAVVALIRVNAGLQHRRSIFSRGAPDDIIQNGVFATGQGTYETWKSATVAWTNHLIANNFALKVLTDVIGSGRVVTTVTVDGLMTTTLAHGLAVGDFVYPSDFL